MKRRKASVALVHPAAAVPASSSTHEPASDRRPSVIDRVVAEAKVDPFSSQSPLEQGFTRRGERAIAANQAAANADVIPRLGVTDEVFYGLEARKARERRDILTEPTEPVRVLCGEAASWDNKIGEGAVGETAWIIDTLERPQAVSVGASGRRLSAARNAEVLEPAIDAAHSAQAANSIEKMLCHQMAAAHFTAMRLIERSAGDRLQPGEVARYTNAAARMMDAYQNACLVLQKLKTKGTQRVVVQYQQVNVSEGGQALVAGRVSRGLRKRGRQRRNAR